MKKRMAIILFTTLIFTSCKNNEPKEGEDTADETSVTDESSKSLNTDKTKDCDEFIDQYETWMDNYLVLLEKYYSNPIDATVSEEYLKLSQESLTWTQQWTGNLYFCASEEKYQKRFGEIADKAQKKLKEMGFE